MYLCHHIHAIVTQVHVIKRCVSDIITHDRITTPHLNPLPSMPAHCM